MSYLALAKRIQAEQAATKTRSETRLTPADCLELLMEMHASNRADYPAGALSLLDTDADLCRRFHATEARIDELAKVAGGPTESDFRRVLAAHAAIWREISQRSRAQMEQQAERADPSPRPRSWRSVSATMW